MGAFGKALTHKFPVWGFLIAGATFYGFAHGGAEQGGEELRRDTGAAGSNAGGLALRNTGDFTGGFTGIDGLTVNRRDGSSAEGGDDGQPEASGGLVHAEAEWGWIKALGESGMTGAEITKCIDDVGGVDELEDIAIHPGANPNPCP